MSNYIIKKIKATEYIGKVGDLIEAHWDEVAKNKHLMILNPNMAMYKALEDADGLLSLGAFIEGQLVGYSVNCIYNHMHYADLKMSQNDVLYVHPDYRNTRIGLALIKETEKAAKEIGVGMILWHAKEASTLDKIMPKLGYCVQDIIYSKGL